MLRLQACAPHLIQKYFYCFFAVSFELESKWSLSCLSGTPFPMFFFLSLSFCVLNSLGIILKRQGYFSWRCFHTVVLDNCTFKAFFNIFPLPRSSRAWQDSDLILFFPSWQHCLIEGIMVICEESHVISTVLYLEDTATLSSRTVISSFVIYISEYQFTCELLSSIYLYY